MFDPKKFEYEIDVFGCSVVEDVVDLDMIMRLKQQLRNAVDREADYHGTTEYNDYGVVQMCPIYGACFIDLLENRELMKPYNAILGDGSIIYVYISSCLPPQSNNRATRVHVDRPHVMPGYTEALAGLILLDDFTEENGSTKYLPGSHRYQEHPGEQFFAKNAKLLEAKAGSVFFFNMRLWHSAGNNNTDKWRDALAIGMVRPFLKQKFDLPRALQIANIDVSGYSDIVLQKLGFHSRPPATLDEYYVPAKRTFNQASEWE